MSLGPSRDEIWCARAIRGLLALSELGFNYQSGRGPFDGTGPGPSGLTMAVTRMMLLMIAMMNPWMNLPIMAMMNPCIRVAEGELDALAM